jgi:hypothetical protein
VLQLERAHQAALVPQEDQVVAGTSPPSVGLPFFADIVSNPSTAASSAICGLADAAMGHSRRHPAAVAAAARPHPPTGLPFSAAIASAPARTGAGATAMHFCV